MFEGLLKSHRVIVLSAPAAHSCESVEGFVRLQAHKTLHTFTKQARLRAWAGKKHLLRSSDCVSQQR